MDRLFIYGTLGPGRPNEHVMQRIGGQWVAGTTRGRLLEAGWGAAMGSPGMVPDAQGELISGHVFESDNLQHHWQELDEFEGPEYQRVLVTVTQQDGSQVDAYIYALRDHD
ncbi:gamma-glutamylcyclotransferase [Halomonas denitrificans]|uniref:gamma-glutamylcyclotransferase family protein n=1 Tax=Halomonas TaxID=2745 RepID=UPI001A8F3321|nr:MULTISPECIES: gamma-glutamylcyclotransferase [Halomonas]MBN8412990.1 gamma-glutamylcyclotransferase [Halomonas litopenaei]MBY5925306.1 gamma-glutamylcyclotransferase [Halomonas sp. DP4Y7-2]MBY5968213.1 gamma-glutamylcyclotransferase [Halomonas denitrificans]MBY5983706.1 gamma-glutamylcyclotransferase [Halomonas sp. DP5Y7-2]MBY6031405.1 gamma-glutamylcyclotransferase [Halomonas sp. DP8Y7-1]